MVPSASSLRRLGRSRWLWVLVGLAVVVLLALGREDGPAAPAPSPPPRPAEPRPLPGGPYAPYPISASAPNAVAPTEVGAVSAAVSYVTAGPALVMMTVEDARAAVRSMAASATAEAQAAEIGNRLVDFERALAGGRGPLQYFQAAVATRVEAFSPVAARIAVWHVGVISKAGVAPPQAAWSTSVVDLVWEGGDWKLERETVEHGPAPMLDRSAPPATSDELDNALAGFVGLDMP